jgi:pimeloyl-ACP methyl ester carboxylesterase
VHATIEQRVSYYHDMKQLLPVMLDPVPGKEGQRWKPVFSQERFDAYYRKMTEENPRTKKWGARLVPCSLKLWWPGTGTVRGCLLVSAWGATNYGRLFRDPGARKRCRELGLAMVLVDGDALRWGSYPSSVLDELLQALGEKAGKEELARLPVISFGFSNASLFATSFAMHHPERTLAWVAGHAHLSRHFELPTIDQVPGLAVHGANDGFLKSTGTGGASSPDVDRQPGPRRDLAVATLRAERDAFVAMAMHPTAGHGMGRGILFSYVTAILKLRDPRKNEDGAWIMNPVRLEDGWLGQRFDYEKGGPQKLTIKPYAEVPEGERLQWNWLPDETFARAWQAYSERARK